MAKRKQKYVDELKLLQLKRAAYEGFLARLHGHMHLSSYKTTDELFDLCREWLAGEASKGAGHIDAF